MNNKIDWKLVRDKFEKDMAGKLKDLPGHREVLESLLDLRSIISHELPETSNKRVFKSLIDMLLFSEGNIDVNKIRDKYLKPELEKEARIIINNKRKFDYLRESAGRWVGQRLPEELLQQEWKEHRTWLPRRYTIYPNPDIRFQQIAIDTLVRYCLIRES